MTLPFNIEERLNILNSCGQCGTKGRTAPSTSAFVKDEFETSLYIVDPHMEVCKLHKTIHEFAGLTESSNVFAGQVIHHGRERSVKVGLTATVTPARPSCGLERSQIQTTL